MNCHATQWAGIQLRRLMRLTLLLVCLVPLPGHGQQLAGAGSLSYLVDTDGKLSLARALASKWTSVDGHQVAPGRAGTVWMRWQLPSAKRVRNRILELDRGGARQVQVWLTNARGAPLQHFDSSRASKRSVFVPGRSGIFISAGNAKAALLVARFQSIEPVVFKPMIWSRTGLTTAGAQLNGAFTILAGVAVAMVLLGLLMAAIQREWVFLAFVFWVPAMLAMQLLESGGTHWSHLFSGGRWHAYANHAAVTLPAIFAGLTSLLTIAMFEVRAAGPVSLRITLEVASMAALLLVVTVSIVPWPLALSMSWALTAVVLLASLLTGVARMRRDRRAAPLFMAGLMAASVAIPGRWLLELGYGPEVLQRAPQTDFFFLAVACLALVVTAAALIQSLYSPDKLQQYAQARLLKTHNAATARLEENVRARTFELEIANEQLARVNRIDGLTGVFNRRHFDECLRSALLRANSLSQPLAVMMIDLDFFKRLNDDYGHAAGDACLIEAAQRAAACVPESEGMVARYGGEEFVALLTHTTDEKAMACAETIRSQIEHAAIDHGGKMITMTASIGLHCAVPTGEPDAAAFLATADDALYQAKENGRNQVVVAPASVQGPAAAVTPPTPAAAAIAAVAN